MELIYKSLFNKIFLKKEIQEHFENYKKYLKEYKELNDQIDKQVKIVAELSSLKNKMRPCVNKIKIVVKPNEKDAEIAYQKSREELENGLTVIKDETIIERILEIKDPMVSKDSESIVISIPYKQYELAEGYSEIDYLNLCKKYDIEKKKMDNMMYKIKDIYSDLRNSEECLYELHCFIYSKQTIERKYVQICS